MSSQPVTLDMSTAQPIQSGVKLDMSTAQPISGAQKPAPSGFLDKEIPLDSYKNATLSGVQSIGRGIRSAGEGIYNTIAHPIDTAKSIAQIPSQVAQVPGAIHDINQSPDPLGTYAKVGQETAGQGAGQALVGLGTEGLGKVAPPVIRGVAKGTNAVLDKAPGAIGASAGAALGHASGIPGGGMIGSGIGYSLGKSVLPKIRIPGEEFGLPKAVDTGAALPEATPTPESVAAPPTASPVSAPTPEKPPIDEAYFAGPRPVIQKGPIPGSMEDRLESQSIEDSIRHAADREGQTIQSQNKREWFGNNQPGTSKSELTGQIAKPVKYTKTPGIKLGTVIPSTDEDLTPILQKSLAQARQLRGQ